MKRISISLSFDRYREIKIDIIYVQTTAFHPEANL